ncbi:sec8 exocyst complex component specific domain-containing protein [Phlyctema vagabunda]|uniref:Exocyst complex component Sec8 n=1 Tax=Phlyctema vagabunda TaxID=108571 RepID=A0ABR4PQP0_9HELO
MERSRYGGLGDDPYASNNGYGAQSTENNDYDPYGNEYGDRYGISPAKTPSPPLARSAYSQPRMPESNAEKQIGVVLEHIKTEWPAMCQNECLPVHVALQLLDTSSVGRAHEYQQFEQTHKYLQDSLKGIVHEHHQGFNSSIGTFHKIQSNIQASTKRVHSLKESLAQSKANLATTDPELKKLAAASQTYDDLLHTLSEIEDLRLVPDQLEARISEKRFLTAVDVLQNALRRIRVPRLDEIGALSDLRSYLANQETALTDILIEELHDHLYLKSPYCQERWQMLAKSQGAAAQDNFENTPGIRPFYEVLDSMDLTTMMIEDPSRNPEADTFYYIELLVESLNKLGRLESAVNTIKQRLPVELFGIVNETNGEVDQKHPSSLRGTVGNAQSAHTFSSRESGIRADVIYDLLWTLYAKFEAIAEGHRVFHDVVKSIVRREGATQNSASLLGGFRELWNLYQNEIRSLLHNYVTTDADIYQFNSSPKPGTTNGKQESRRELFFQFSDADSKSISMTTEYQDLEGIIRAAVPGLMSKSGDGKKKDGGQRSLLESSIAGSRRAQTSSMYDKHGGITSHKSLVEPSVFNMSLLLPPTLGFLQRLKIIVPPGSDLVTSTLTSFLDNFLVNVFLPQLDETLGKLSDSVFEEADSFQEDSEWTKVARRPVFKGTTAFFALITAFCRMLDTIPHDQALSQLIITQMMRYYDRCYDWFKSLVSKVSDTDGSTLKLAALLATGPGDIHDTMQKLWTEEETDQHLLEKETGLLILQTNETALKPDDIIQDRETISSLCVLYTSMKWLAIKIDMLRHITRNDVDSSRPTAQKSQNRRWTLLNDPSRAQDDISVYLPMTQETVVAFDSIVSSYQELAGTVLLTLHMEIRCQIVQSISKTLSPVAAPYLLEQAVNDPDPKILSLNADLVSYDETVVRFLREREIQFIRTGLGLLIDTYLVTNAGIVKAMNKNGCGRMQLNILVLQQNLKNIETDVSLDRAAKYFDIFDKGADATVAQAKLEKENGNGGKESFNYEELKTLVELCYSEQLSNPERGISTVAKRRMDEHLLQLSEYMWQS